MLFSVCFPLLRYRSNKDIYRQQKTVKDRHWTFSTVAYGFYVLPLPFSPHFSIFPQALSSRLTHWLNYRLAVLYVNGQLVSWLCD